jgi:hypothetical protein
VICVVRAYTRQYRIEDNENGMEKYGDTGSNVTELGSRNRAAALARHRLSHTCVSLRGFSYINCNCKNRHSTSLAFYITLETKREPFASSTLRGLGRDSGGDRLRRGTGDAAHQPATTARFIRFHARRWLAIARECARASHNPACSAHALVAAAAAASGPPALGSGDMMAPYVPSTAQLSPSGTSSAATTVS